MTLSNNSSDEQIEKMIKPLSDIYKEELVKNMTSTETILTDGKEVSGQ